MVVGVGTDIVVVDDLHRRMDRTPGLEDRVFDPAESAFCRTMADPWQHFAARFAAKEATMKALGTGWGDGVDFRDIVVVRDLDRPPRLDLRGGAAQRAGALGGRASLSLSHAGGLAIAFVVLDRE